MNKLTLLLLSILFSNLTYSQVIEVSYQEQLAFAYVESESLIKQWKNDEVIWDEYSYGYPPGEGRIVYTFDFNNMKRFVFLDRDGVINVERGDYAITIAQWEWAPGAIEGIKLLTNAGFGIIVITNQSCIAKGLQTEEGLAKLHGFMVNHIRKAGHIV